MFFIRSDIKYQILNVEINFAPNIETIKIFFLITYLTIYSLENIIDIYVQTPNMLAFFMLSWILLKLKLAWVSMVSYLNNKLKLKFQKE